MLDILANFVCDGGIEALLVRHLLFDVCPGHLVQLIHRGRDGADLVWRHSANLEDTVEDFAVIDLHDMSASTSYMNGQETDAP